MCSSVSLVFLELRVLQGDLRLKSGGTATFTLQVWTWKEWSTVVISFRAGAKDLGFHFGSVMCMHSCSMLRQTIGNMETEKLLKLRD